MRLRLLVFLIIVLPTLAVAQSSSIAPVDGATTASLNLTPGEDDLTIAILRNMLGEWGGSPYAPVIGAAMAKFNAGMLVLAAAMFMYTAVVGTLHSAHDGEILGKRWSSLWVPVRLAGGVAMLFPTASGFSIGQIFILWVASQGIGLANLVWSGAADSFLTAQGAVVSVRLLESGQIAPAMKQILKSEICVARLAKEYSTQTGITDNSVQANNSGYTGGSLSWGGMAGLSGGIGGILVPRDACGVMQLPRRTVLTQLAGNLSQAESAMIRAQTDGVLAAAAHLRTTAAKLVNENDETDTATLITADLKKASEIYLQTTAGAAQATSDAAYSYLTKVVQNDTDESGAGWLGAGSWYFQMARINSQIGKSTSWMPTVEGTDSTTVAGSGVALEDIVDAVDVNADLRKPVVAGQKSGDFGKTVGGIPGLFKTGDASDAVISKGMNALGYNPDNPEHPIVQLKDTGDYLMGGVESVFVTVGVGKMLLELLPAGGIISKVSAATSAFKQTKIGAGLTETLSGPFSAISAIAVTVLGALFVFGVMLSLYIPMVPFIVWIGGLVGYFITVFSAVVAVPVWLAAHLHPEGDGMSGKYGARGYALLAEVFGRPVLMVFGLIGALVVLPPLLGILHGLFTNAIGAMQADSVSGMATWLVLVGMYVGLCVTLVHKVSALIHIVPNTVPKWFNGEGAGDSQ